MRMLAVNQKANLRGVSANFRIRLVVAARRWAVRDATFGVVTVGFPLARILPHFLTVFHQLPHH